MDDLSSDDEPQGARPQSAATAISMKPMEVKKEDIAALRERFSTKAPVLPTPFVPSPQPKVVESPEYSSQAMDKVSINFELQEDEDDLEKLNGIDSEADMQRRMTTGTLIPLAQLESEDESTFLIPESVISNILDRNTTTKEGPVKVTTTERKAITKYLDAECRSLVEDIMNQLKPTAKTTIDTRKLNLALARLKHSPIQQKQ